MKKEIWKNIKGYEYLYQVSNLGRFKSFNNKNNSGNILKTTIRNDGYLIISLSLNGKSKTCLAHIIVAKTFILNALNLPEVNHKDENRANPIADNLEWCTHKYNINYGMCRMRGAKTNSKKVYQYTTGYKLMQVWDSSIQAEKTANFKSKNIRECCGGTQKTHRGYIWSYVPIKKELEKYRYKCKHFRTEERCGKDNKNPKCDQCSSFEWKMAQRY